MLGKCLRPHPLLLLLTLFPLLRLVNIDDILPLSLILFSQELFLFLPVRILDLPFDPFFLLSFLFSFLVG